MIKKMLALLLVFLLILSISSSPIKQSYACYGGEVPDPQPVQPVVCP